MTAKREYINQPLFPNMGIYGRVHRPNDRVKKKKIQISIFFIKEIFNDLKAFYNDVNHISVTYHYHIWYRISQVSLRNFNPSCLKCMTLSACVCAGKCWECDTSVRSPVTIYQIYIYVLKERLLIRLTPILKVAGI